MRGIRGKPSDLRRMLGSDYILSNVTGKMGHFRITFGLFFKGSPGAHLFI